MEKNQFKKLSLGYMLLAACALGSPERADATTYEYELSNSAACGGGTLLCGAGMNVYDLNGFEAKFAFNFEAPNAGMSLIYDSVADSIRIVGKAYAYLFDSDSGWNATSAALGNGYYDFDFTYRANVSLVPGSGLVVSASALNNGTLEKTSGFLDGYTFFMNDKNAGSYSLAFGPLGTALSAGSGWFMLSGLPYSGVGDFAFTGRLKGNGGCGYDCSPEPVPEPGTVLLLGSAMLGAVAAGRRARPA